METSLPNRIYLQLKFYTFKINDSKSIDENVDDFLKLVADLNNFGMEVSEEVQAILLLSSLPYMYDQLKETLKYDKETLRLNEVIRAAKAKEKELTENNPKEEGSELTENNPKEEGSELYVNDRERPIKTLEKGQSSSSPAKAATFHCEICVEHKPRTGSFRINGCSHFYCNDCVSKYIAAKLQDNMLSIQCPVSGCSGQFEPDQCREILPKEVFERWGDALCEALMMSSKRYYCPYKDCSALLFLEESDKNMKESECPHCHRMVCVECGTKWHPEIDCKEFQKLAENEREREDILLRKMVESKNWKRCPSCKYYIEKSEGCLYMKCRCGLAFCYNCGTPSKDNSHYCYSCKR